MPDFFFYLLIMAGVTYLVRMLPLVLVKQKIKNRFLLSFLHYIPYSVLTVMTVPAVFSATGDPISASFGFAAAIVVAYLKGNLVITALSASAAVLFAELLIKLL